MARYGYVIRMGGDPEISGALRNGMEKGTQALPADEGGATSETIRRLAMMRHTPEEWRQMTEEARVIHGGRKILPRWVERLLVAYAMICYGISRAYRVQDRLLVSRGYQRERRVI